jgi:mannose-1-phosphate guanylyltransferase/mannose-6-phosphate isomerase
MLHPVILSGGSGERLWPASKPSHPKPFLPLVGEETTFGNTFRRADALPGAAPVTIVAGHRHEDVLSAAIDGREALVILEPEPRNTAAAMAASALVLGGRDPDAVLLFLPADHVMPDATAFAAHIASMARQAASGWIALLGLTPSGPSTAYGYIQAEPCPDGPRPVTRFVEKPDVTRAAALIAEGWLWNAGVFAVRADVLIDEMRRHAPGVLAAAAEAVKRHRRSGRTILLDPAFRDAPNVSFDVAVMERTDRAVVEPASFAWADLGAWDAVLAASDRDPEGNSAAGRVVLEDAANCLVRAADGMTVAVVGARNLAVIVDQGAVMVCDLQAGHQVRAAINRVSAGER